MKLVIVESPSKAKTITKYLGDGYKVTASGGHVCDLPAKKLGVNVHENFEPVYEVYEEKKATIKQLKKDVSQAECVYLATDPDREGEAISWHLKKLLNLKDENIRIVFNEITKKAVNKAIETPSCINMELVNSQQARRILDRLVGYMVSPVMSKKIKKGLSAGRVQSVALKMIVERENEIRNFKPEEYWNIFAFVGKDVNNFYKSSFNDVNGKKTKVDNGDFAKEIIENSKLGSWYVDKIKRAKSYSKALAPFTTSTLQQDAVNKLNMSATVVMQTAQKLYEGVNIKGEGQVALVTYIRTDSVRISDDAQKMAKDFILAKFGKDYCPQKPNFYQTKGNAQDAHEAIRPISLDRTPEELKSKIEPNQYRLYKLIYERFVASQMTNAEYDTLNVHITSEYSSKKYGYTLKGRTLIFPGFLSVYAIESNEEDGDSLTLPQLDEGNNLILKEIKSEQKFTKPPARYSDSSLIKAMEENGIGRPSTYASIIQVISKRLYTEKEGKFLKPTELGEIVTEQLVKYFPDIMDTMFTAGMESKLDVIAEGNIDWHKVIADFYPDFLKAVERANDGQKVKIEPIMTDIICEKCGKNMVIRDGRYGKFLGCSGFPDCNNIKPYQEKKEGNEEPETMICDKCGKTMSLKKGRYGEFWGCDGYPECNNIIKANKKRATTIVDETLKPEICDKCGAVMVLKEGRYGKFYACPNYPKCQNIKSFNEIVGKCPHCGKNIFKRIGKNGSTFYVCEDGENCKFISYVMPAPKLCDKCNHFMGITKDGDKTIYLCQNKNCANKEEV